MGKDLIKGMLGCVSANPATLSTQLYIQTPTMHCGARLAGEHANESGGGGGSRAGHRGGAQRTRA